MIVPILIFLILLAALTCQLFSSEQVVVYAKKRVHRINSLSKRHKDQLINSRLETQMRELGLPFSLYHYQVARFTLLIIGLLAFLISSLISGMTFSKNICLLILLVVFFITKPTQRVFGSVPFFKKFLDALQASKRQQYNRELYLLISQLRNSFKVYGDKAPSATEIFSELIRYTDKTKPIFQKFLSFWISGDQEKALKYFEVSIGTKEAENLAQMFEKIDRLSPEKLDQQLESFQKIYRGERGTARIKEDEKNSNIVFALVIGACFMILLDFIAVGFIVDLLLVTNDLF